MPRFSVIIPTYHRPQCLAECLEALGALEYPREQFEVIVVDDGGCLPAGDFARFSEVGLNVVFLAQSHAGPGAARNLGAAHARGDVLVFTDDDCRPRSDWLAAVDARLRTNGGCLIAGQLLNLLHANWFAVANDLLLRYLFGYWNANAADATFIVSANIAVEASAFHELRGFDPTFTFAGGEDRDFCVRWIASGRRVVFAPEIVVYHAHRMWLRGFFRQHFNYGRGASLLHRLHGQAATDAKLERWAFYTGLFGSPFAGGYRLTGPILTALLCVSQVASVIGFCSDRYRR